MKAFTQRFVAWLLGLTTIMRYFVIALLVHVGLVVVLGSIKIVAIVPKIVAAFNPPPLPPSLEDQPEDAFAAYRDFDYTGPTMGEGGGLGGKGPGGAPTAGGEKASILDDTKPTEAAAVNEVIGVFSDSATAIARPSVGPSGVGMAPVGGLGDVLAGTSGVKGPGGGVLGARMGAARATNLKAHGGSQRTEQSVLAALRWFKANQKPDGSWDGPNPAASGLTVLAFLGHGENADSAEFGATVSKGIDYIVKSVPAANGNYGNMYQQGILGITLAEALSLTGSPVLREPLEKVIKFILDAQKTPKRDPLNKWGWRYLSTSDTSDMSVSGWQIMALKSARNAGMQIPNEVFEHAADYVWNQFGTHGFGYAGPGDSWTVTGAGVLCEIFLGNGKDKRIDKALDFLNANAKVNWETAPVRGGFYLYGWYYATLSLFQGSAMRGGGHWPAWNTQFQKAIVEAQAEDGHWELPPKAAEVPYGKTYCTALCTLMLEVYYRYLPLYQVTGAGGGGPPSRNTGGNLPTSSGPPS